MPWRAFEIALLVMFAIAVPQPVKAAPINCKGTCFIYCELECEMTAPPVNAASFCAVMNRQGGPVRWGSADTYETKARADKINAAGKRLCGWNK